MHVAIFFAEAQRDHRICPLGFDDAVDQVGLLFVEGQNPHRHPRRRRMVHQLDDVFIDGLRFDRVGVEQFTFARFAGLLAVRGFDDGPATDDAVGVRRRPYELARHTDKTDRWLRLRLALG